MTQSLVSVIIPTYNRSDTIEEAVDSLLRQSHPATEVLVVDDGSTDDTADRLARFGDRIKFIRKPNGGCASARNLGLEHASGQYVAWMDSDDVCAPDRIALQAAALDGRPDSVLVSSDFSAIDPAGRLIEPSHIGSYYGTVREAGGASRLYDSELASIETAGGRTRLFAGSVYEKLIWGNFIHPPTVMTRRDALEKSGGFDSSVPNNAEYDCIIRVARQGTCLYLDAPLLLYRVSPTQMSGAPGLWKLKADTARIMRKVANQDPAFARRFSQRLHGRIGKNLADAAFLRADSDRAHSWRLLREAVTESGVSRGAMRAAVRLLAPDVAISAVRRWRRARS